MTATQGRFSPSRFASVAQSIVRRRVAQFMANQPTYLSAGPVRLGQNVVGWRTVDWEGENQAQTGSFFHGAVAVGRRTRFGAYSYVTGDVTFGRYGSYGAQVAAISHDRHPLRTPALYVSPALPRPSRGDDEGWKSAGSLRVGHDVWIGHGAVVLGSVTVGNGAVIGANSVVSSDVAPYTIVAGAPARLVRPRFDDELIELLESWAWWDLDDSEIRSHGDLIDLDLTADRDRSIELLRAAVRRRS